MANETDNTKEVRASIRISESLDFLLAREAHRQKCSKSDVARKALEAYLYGDGPLTRDALRSKLSQLLDNIDKMPENAFPPAPKGRTRR